MLVEFAYPFFPDRVIVERLRELQAIQESLAISRSLSRLEEHFGFRNGFFTGTASPSSVHCFCTSSSVAQYLIHSQAFRFLVA